MRESLHWRRRCSLPLLLACIALLAVGLAVYVPLLPPLQMPSERLTIDWLRAHSPIAPWLGSVPGAGYRPLALTIWRLLTLLPGQASTLIVRYLSLGLHLGNALLVVALVARWKTHRGPLLSLATALLFLLFPWSYRALWGVNSLPLTLGTAFLLAALLVACSASTPWRGRGILSLLLVLAALLTHEIGTLVAPLLTLILTVNEPGLPSQKLLQRTAPYWLLTMVGFGLQRLVLAGNLPVGGSLQATDLVGQALAGWSPSVAWALARGIDNTGGVCALLASMLLGGAVIAALRLPVQPWKLGGLFLAWFAFLQVPSWALPLFGAWLLLLWAGGCGRLLALALGWLACWLVTPLLFPSTAGDGASSLYGASIGAALLWAIPLEVLWRRRTALAAPAACLVLGLAACSCFGMRVRKPVVVHFEPQLALLATCERRAEGARLTLEWQCRQPVGPDVTVFAHLYDEAGHLVTQADGDPLSGKAPLWTCQPGTELIDSRLLALPPGLKRGRYTVKVGLYDRSSGARMPATGPDGTRYADEAAPVVTLVMPW